MSRDIFIFAGEDSGDLHGEQLIKKLKEHHPQLDIYGVGGPRMRKAGLAPLLPMEAFEVMGFIDVFRHLPRLARQFFFLRNTLLREKPKVVLLIDYPGFNLALAKSLSKRGFSGKICHYICPSVWAWNKKRIPKMEKSLDHLFTILPFEPALFDQKKLHAQFVGHPLIHRPFTPTKVTVPEGKRPIAIFPGSRSKELERNLPLQLEVAKRLLQEFPDLYFLISVAKPSFAPFIKEKIELLKLPAALEENAEGLMDIAECAIATSGTITLELALQKIPTVVTYGISPLDLFIARRLLRIRLPYYCLVNILAQERLFPELIGPHFTAETLHKELHHLLSSEEARSRCREKCHGITIMLGEKQPELEIAGTIKQFL
ncbi:MAG: Lipid-A-disaccharide synthase [Chlamydiae bacterium]|nr:Lipid-A-disaccharide synthase [Chlamydiota bacterium]